MEQQDTPVLAPEHRHRVGMRIIKTVVAVFLCGLLAFLRDKSALYSMFAALFCIQRSTGETIESSINRVLGTLIGGAVGVLTAYAMYALKILHIDLLRYLLLALLLIPIIKFTLLIKKPDLAGMACVVVICMVAEPGDQPVIYSFERLFETALGVVLACGIDILLPHQPVPRPNPPEPSGEPRPQPEPERKEDRPAGKTEEE